jgi:hypothetical protein
VRRDALGRVVLADITSPAVHEKWAELQQAQKLAEQIKWTLGGMLQVLAPTGDAVANLEQMVFVEPGEDSAP